VRSKVKITVLRRVYHRDLYERYGLSLGEPCAALQDGQEFVVPEQIAMPAGFCSWAWCDTMKYVVTLARGGNLSGSKPGVFVASCSDGYRPVIFALERIGPDTAAAPGSES
jgi:uncharacterized repeat protein (TIGR04076 family)